MTIRRAPPPPLPKWKRRAVPEETAVLKKWERYIGCLAQDVYYARRLGMDHEDVGAELRRALVAITRKSLHKDGVIPSDALVKTVLSRRLLVLRRDASAGYREELYNDVPIEAEDGRDIVEDETPDQHAGVEQSELTEVCVAAAYALRRNLPPAIYAVLQLRCAEELPAKQIAEMAAMENWELISGKIHWAKGRAREFLESIGIPDWKTLSEMSAEEFDYDDCE